MAKPRKAENTKAKKSPAKQDASFINIKLSRRDFIKKSLIGAAAIGVGAYALTKAFSGSSPVPSSPAQTIYAGDAPKELWKWSKEAFNYVQLGKDVQCRQCPRHCVLAPGDRGFCRVRAHIANLPGKLYSLVYGNPCAVHSDPVEKKPLFHFLPGTNALSIATAGCNVRCLYCQNWQISQFKPEETENADMFPDSVAMLAKSSDNVKSVAYTYSEPTVYYEYMYDTSVAVRKAGLKNAVISSMYMEEKPLKELTMVVDAIKVDLKGFTQKFYSEVTSVELETVLRNIKTIHDSGTWLEIVYLVVPTLNDNEDDIKSMCEWVRKNVGVDVPLHFTRFHPDHKLRNLPQTPLATLEIAYKAAKEAGLNYVYVGNVPGSGYENTICPKDGTVCVERNGFTIIKNILVDGRCPTCGTFIPGIWD